jgi:hypothetical protein
MTKEEMKALAIKVTKEAIKNSNSEDEIKMLKNRLHQAEKK